MERDAANIIERFSTSVTTCRNKLECFLVKQFQPSIIFYCKTSAYRSGTFWGKEVGASFTTNIRLLFDCWWTNVLAYSGRATIKVKVFLLIGSQFLFTQVAELDLTWQTFKSKYDWFWQLHSFQWKKLAIKVFFSSKLFK